MLRQFVYPTNVSRDEEGYFLVTFPDFPEAGTDGPTLEDALADASDCLAEAVAGRIVRMAKIPKAARKQRRQYAITVPTQIAAKAALYLAMKETKTKKSTLARRLAWSETAVQRLLDPKQSSEMKHFEEALAIIGQELVVGVQASAVGETL
jgi:antitoxin HicB